MPHTLAALESGVLSEWRATLIVRESACLDVEDRRRLDAELCADPATLEGKGDARIAADAKAIAYRLDPHAVVDRAARAETERCVTVRPAPDCMTYVTALLPMTQGVGVYAALKRAADTCFDGRSRGQVMADTLVERVTGRPADTATPIAVNLVLSDDTLFGAGSDAGARSPATGRCRRRSPADLIRTAVYDRQSKATLRRLYKHPASGALVAMESRARLLPARAWPRSSPLATTRCRTPYCDAPIRHIDHADPGRQRRTNHRRQRPRHLRRLQLRQRSRRLACHHGAPTKTASTQPNSPPRPAADTVPPHRPYPGASPSARSS